MKKEDLIIKWLDNNLNEEELKAFKKLDASSAFMKIDEAAQKFAAPSFDENRVFEQIQQEKYQAPNKTSWLRYVSGIAAAVVVCFGLYYAFLFNVKEGNYIAENSQHIEFTLPDNTEVVLNAGSSIYFDEDDWDAGEIKLQGEAYFKTPKGSDLVILTEHGIVSVLGTEFTINARSDYFEVTCYEGLVQIWANDKMNQLPAGQSFKIFNGKEFNSSTTQSEPSWVNAKTIFKSVPFYEVINELERQYDIKVTLNPIDRNTVYTGSFTHENLETALEAITIPLNLSYDLEGKNVVLKSN
ncbi:MAG: FecR family protein [Flavobacteriaceae bacterium]|nr:FecR family protein [Flavobacteriaceae bacterium]